MVRSYPRRRALIATQVGQYTLAVALTFVLSTQLAAAASGKLKLMLPNVQGVPVQPAAAIMTPAGQQVGQVVAGGEVSLPPGEYELVLPVIGGNIERGGLQIAAGRTLTVKIDNVAALHITALDVNGHERNFPVTVTDSRAPHHQLAQFKTGGTWLFAPGKVDVAVAAPPQGYFWPGVTLTAGGVAHIALKQQIPAQLRVLTTVDKQPIDGKTRVVIFHHGTQRQVATDGPSPSHQFTLDPGDYDIYVENLSGYGRPYILDPGIHLSSGAKVEHQVTLDKEASSHGN
ncbi:MAG TPA: hypothetical protein VKV28_16540 [Candidatus Binataceae bacterium]|nr:hypothetical protein [Candidatus Binataceae bacterium]